MLTSKIIIENSAINRTPLSAVKNAKKMPLYSIFYNVNYLFNDT